MLARAPAAQLGSRAGARKGVLVGSLHGLGFLEEGLVSQKTPAGAPLHSPLSPPSEHQSLCQPLAWLRALTCRGEAVGGHSAIGGGFPRARTGSLLSGITECTLAASPHIRSLCPPHPRPGEDPASENGQGLPEGAGPIIGVSEGQTSNTVAVSLWASQPEVQASLTRHLRSARTVVTLGPVCPHAHLLPGLCKGPGASSPKPTQPPHAGTHTHTHTCLLHTLAAGHTVSGRGRRQGPPSSHPPLTHRPMSEQVLESAATAAWAKAWGPQWTRCRETTTVGTMMASASTSASRTRLTAAPRPWAMALTGPGERGGRWARSWWTGRCTGRRAAERTR